MKIESIISQVHNFTWLYNRKEWAMVILSTLITYTCIYIFLQKLVVIHSSVKYDRIEIYIHVPFIDWPKLTWSDLRKSRAAGNNRSWWKIFTSAEFDSLYFLRQYRLKPTANETDRKLKGLKFTRPVYWFVKIYMQRPIRKSTDGTK